MSMNLFEIDDQINELTERMVDPETGEIDDSILAEVDDLELDKKKIIEHLALKAKDLRAYAEALEAEKTKLEKRIKASGNHAERIENYIAGSLKGKDFCEGIVNIHWRKSERVECINEDIIPEEFIKYETKGKIQKSLIKKAIKDGKEVPGAVLKYYNNMKID